MRKEPDLQVAFIAFCAVFGTALPILAIAAWDQALDFNPCANIFVKPTSCIESGWSFAAGGVFLIVLGGTIVVSAARSERTAETSALAVIATGWLGLWMVVIGAAMVFAGLSMP